MKKIILILLGVLLVCCKNERKERENKMRTDNIDIDNSKDNIENNKAEKIISQAIEAHGGDLYSIADYSFVFRKKTYHFTNNQDKYTYSVEDKGKKVKDFIIDGKFSRYINEGIVELSETDMNKYTGALNSVIYFATLPHKLNDVAVNKKYIEETTIKNERYHVVEITFKEEGGGEDHDDEYHYWVNKKTNKIDYLAYNYRVNNGGVRYRSYYNRRVVDGITFQDYINWEVPVDAPLKDLPALYEQGKLKELSRIETENVINLNKK